MKDTRHYDESDNTWSRHRHTLSVLDAFSAKQQPIWLPYATSRFYALRWHRMAKFPRLVYGMDLGSTLKDKVRISSAVIFFAYISMLPMSIVKGALSGERKAMRYSF